MFSPGWRRAILLAPIIVSALVAAPARAFFDCVAHPLSPLCCPSPCPVADLAKLGKLTAEAQEAWNAVQEYQATANQYLQLFNGLGPEGRLATALRRVPGNVSADFSTFRTSLPAMLQPGDLSDPRAVAEILKQAMFEPQNGSSVTAGGTATRALQRAGAAVDEDFTALSASFHGFSRLIDVAADGGQRTVAASQAANDRSDTAANISARQALLDNLVGLQELLSTWAASQATHAALANTATLGAVPAAPATNVPPAAQQAAFAQLDGLRQARMAVQQMDATVSALTALHNQRHATNVMLAQYPGLRTTIASDDLAAQMQTADAANTAQLLGQLYRDGTAAFRAVQPLLLSLDTTGWKDSATKMQAAMAAAQTAVAAIAADPGAFGTPVNANTGLDADLVNNLANSFAGWLEDDKLTRFWQPLRKDAEQSLAALDQRIAEVSGQFGFDVVGSAGIAQERQLLAQFQQQVGQFPQVATSLNTAQSATLSALVGSLQQAAAAVQSDQTAQTLVTVAWPQ